MLAVIFGLYMNFFCRPKGAPGHGITVDLPKEKTINKEQKIAQFGKRKPEINKRWVSWQKTSLLGNESSPLVVYFVNILIGIFFFVVFIREVVSYGNLVLAS